MFVAKIKHPNGDIAQLLLLNGLARCADWMSPLLGGEAMQKLRHAERYIPLKPANHSQAKTRKLNLWKDHTAKQTQTTSSFDATVLRIVNGDTIEVVPKTGGPRKTIQFSSIRQPKYPPNFTNLNVEPPMSNKHRGKQKSKNTSANVLLEKLYHLK
jgi:staphylococcal nuclease domain-containing protein 1